jgi:hypothetical protein
MIRGVVREKIPICKGKATMRCFKRTVFLVFALSVPGLLAGCYYSHTVDKTPPAVVTSTPPAVVTTPPDTSSTTTTTTSNNGQVERQTTTTYPNP